jgi:hypothetical protein
LLSCAAIILFYFINLKGLKVSSKTPEHPDADQDRHGTGFDLCLVFPRQIRVQ